MVRPILRKNKSVAASQRNNNRYCQFHLPGLYLAPNIRKRHVKVERTDGLSIAVLSAKVHNSILVVKTEEVTERPPPVPVANRRSRPFGDTEEIEVTVTDPVSGDKSVPVVVEVVIFDEEPPPPPPRPRKTVKRKSAKRKKTSAK